MTLVKFFNRISDFLFVSRKIHKKEIIIRTLLQPKHISLGCMDIVERKFDSYFLPLKGGVSVDRYRYKNENQSKESAKKKFTSDTAKYIGFAIFDIQLFEECLTQVAANHPELSVFRAYW